MGRMLNKESCLGERWCLNFSILVLIDEDANGKMLSRTKMSISPRNVILTKMRRRNTSYGRTSLVLTIAPRRNVQ